MFALLFLIVALSFTTTTIFGYEFNCSSGTGFGNSTLSYNSTQQCESFTCIIFYDFCDNFWATSCYDPNNRMALAKKYQRVRNRHQNSRFWKFFTCQSSNCNSNPFNYIYTIKESFYYKFIDQEPDSFDSKIWMTTGYTKKLKPKDKMLQNGAVLNKETNRDEYYIFGRNIATEYNFITLYGNIKPNATKFWIEFHFFNISTVATSVIKLTVNIKNNSTVTIKYGKQIKHFPIVYPRPKKLPLDSDIEIEIYNTNETYPFYINGNFTGFSLPKTHGNITTFYYGGKWKITSATSYQFENGTGLINKGKEVSVNPFDKKIMYPRKIAILKTHDIPFPLEAIPKHQYLNITEIGYKIVASKAKLNLIRSINGDSNAADVTHLNISLPTILDSETKRFEFRDSLEPGSDLLRYEITSINKSGDNEKRYFHVNLWVRKNLQWFQEKSEFMEMKNCTKIFFVSYYENMNRLECSPSKLSSIPLFSGSSNTLFEFTTRYPNSKINYFVFEYAKHLICDKTQ